MDRAISQEELVRRMLRCGGVSVDEAENRAVMELIERHEREQQRVEALEADAKLIGQAAHRTVGRSCGADGRTCRWCDGRDLAHHPECPVRTLVDIVLLIAAPNDEVRQCGRESLQGVGPAEVR